MVHASLLRRDEKKRTLLYDFLSVCLAHTQTHASFDSSTFVNKNCRDCTTSCHYFVVAALVWYTRKYITYINLHNSTTYTHTHELTNSSLYVCLSAFIILPFFGNNSRTRTGTRLLCEGFCCRVMLCYGKNEVSSTCLHHQCGNATYMHT